MNRFFFFFFMNIENYFAYFQNEHTPGRFLVGQFYSYSYSNYNNIRNFLRILDVISNVIIERVQII